MTEHIVKLAISYVVDFVPYRHRLPRKQAVRSDGHVMIREVAPEAAPVSHRILGRDDRIQAEVRHFEGAYWWLLNHADAPMSVENFIALAQEGDWAVSNALDIEDYWARNTEDELLGTKPRVLNSEYKEQWNAARRGASKVLFCESMVLIEAGPPNYCGIRSETDSAISFVVGPSSLDRIQGDDLFGPHIRERQWAARQGLLFETQEFDREMAILDCRADSIDVLCRVEDVLQLPVPQVAPRKCARALAEHLWGA
jgi:hypothetical protein